MDSTGLLSISLVSSWWWFSSFQSRRIRRREKPFHHFRAQWHVSRGRGSSRRGQPPSWLIRLSPPVVRWRSPVRCHLRWAHFSIHKRYPRRFKMSKKPFLILKGYGTFWVYIKPVLSKVLGHHRERQLLYADAELCMLSFYSDQLYQFYHEAFFSLLLIFLDWNVKCDLVCVLEYSQEQDMK